MSDKAIQDMSPDEIKAEVDDLEYEIKYLQGEAARSARERLDELKAAVAS